MTLLHLLSHTSGLPDTPSKTEPPGGHLIDATTAMENRMVYVRNALADKPQAPPGKKFIYSGGHIIVACYAERVMNKSSEALMEQFLFKRLGMTTASHWTNATPPDKVDGPWAHDRQTGRLRRHPPSSGRGFSRVSVDGVGGPRGRGARSCRDRADACSEAAATSPTCARRRTGPAPLSKIR